MNEPGVVLRVTGSTGFAVFGIVADVSAVILLAMSEDVREAVSQNPLIAILVGGASLLLALILINLVSRNRASELKLRARIDELEDSLRSPVNADIKRWNEFWADFGRDSALYVWLKEEFYGSYAWEQEIDELNEIYRKWSRDPIEYYDETVQQAFSPLRESVSKLYMVLSRYYWVERIPGEVVEIGRRRLMIPPEWDYEKKDEAVAAINSAWDDVMDRYDKFTKAAKDRKLLGTEASSAQS